jgi:LPS-assembly protein
VPAISPSSLIKPLRYSFSFLLTTSLVYVPNSAVAAGDDIGFANKAVCVAPIIQIPELLKSAPEGALEDQEIGLEGDSMDLQGKNKITMTGNAQVVQGARGVFADRIVYDQESYHADLNGNVTYFSEHGDEIKTDTMRLDIDTFIGDTGKAQMRLADRGRVPKKASINYVEDYSLLAPFSIPRDFVEQEESEDGPRVENRIWADKIEIEGESFQHLTNAKITRCPEGEDVAIYGDEIDLDRVEGVGYAKNVTVKFKGVPILWAPAFSFPLNDQRKTGFLAPSIGDDENSGAILAAPYYFNLAENYDATLRPTWYANRGGQLYGEFRYLNESGAGVIRGEYLPGDDLFNDEDRYGYAVDLRQNYSNGWGLDVDLADVSDTSYLNDFRNDINLTSTTHLQQRGQINYNNSYIYMRGTASKWEAVAPDLIVSQPYDRLPQIEFGVPSQDYGPFELALDTELITFDHENPLRVTGTRVNLLPSIEMPYEPIYGYVKPKLAYRVINYQLDNTAEFTDDAPSVGAPLFSVDSGLYFERETSWGGEAMTHTLEPRAMYVYIPEENQDDMPIFDTGEGTVSNYNVLFREYRFFGGDRIGDDNHLALGLTSTMISENTGQERMRTSIGQLYYFADREVTASGVPETETKSDIFAELNVVLSNQIDFRSFLRWNQEEGELSDTTVGIDYSAGYRRKVTLDYFKFSRVIGNAVTENAFTENAVINNQTDEDVRLQLDWPLGPRWQFSTGQRYSIQDAEFRESSYGLVYDGCCWAVGLRGSNILQSDGEFNTRIVLSFELDGLGKIDTGF